MINCNYDNIPQEIKALRQWVCFSLQFNEERQKYDKIPKSPLRNENGSPTNPKKWGTFEEACNAVDRFGYDGIGFVFTADSPFCGADIDHCVNTDTGEINELAADIVDTMDTYTELSPSGTGLHIIYKGDNHPKWRKKVKDALGENIDLEMYQSGRYFTVTGNRYGECSTVNEAENMAQLVYKVYMQKNEPVVTSTPSSPCKPVMPLSDCGNSQSLSDEKIIELASKYNKSFSSLYSGNTSEYGNDESRADAALCAILAFYTKDTTQIDRIFRKSGLMRDKWDRPTAGSTYGKITIENALKLVTASYDADYRKEPPVAHLKKSDISEAAETVGNNEPFRIEIPEFSFENIKYWEQNPISIAQHFADCIKDYVCYVPELKGFMITIGKSLMLSLIFPPFHTVLATFTAHGVPS